MYDFSYSNLIVNNFFNKLIKISKFESFFTQNLFDCCLRLYELFIKFMNTLMNQKLFWLDLTAEFSQHSANKKILHIKKHAIVIG